MSNPRDRDVTISLVVVGQKTPCLRQLELTIRVPPTYLYPEAAVASALVRVLSRLVEQELGGET